MYRSQSVPLQTWTPKRFGSDPALQVTVCQKRTLYLIQQLHYLQK